MEAEGLRRDQKPNASLKTEKPEWKPKGEFTLPSSIREA